jgi:hypothetical protein
VIERLHEEFKRRIKTQTVLPSAGTAAMLFWALSLVLGQSTSRVDGRHAVVTKPIDQQLDLSARNDTFMLPEIATPNSTTFATAPCAISK